MYKITVLKVVVLTLFFCFSGSSFAAAVSVFARATKYDGGDKNTDEGRTSTKVMLRKSTQKTIGIVAVDPDKIPYGSLVYSPCTNRFFLACDFGEAVVKRTAAKQIAKKKGLPKKYSNALVLDFYSSREILDEHFGEFYVVKHNGEKPFIKLHKEYQDLRLKPKFWIDKIKKMEKNEELEEIKESLLNMSSSK